MVNTVTGLTGSGLKDWWIQRLSAVILASYVIFLTAFIALHASLQFTDWQALFSNQAFRIYSFFAILSLVAHAWIGAWTILTDYVHCSWIRGVLQCVLIASLLSSCVWGVLILWGA